MLKRMTTVLRLMFLIMLGANASVRPAQAEPSYCRPDRFFAKEIPNASGATVKRLRLFQLGEVTVAGLAVGESPVSETRNLARHFSSVSSSEKFCTWYLHEDNPEAAREFNQHYLALPIFYPPEMVADKYQKELGSSFALDPISFLSCAENFHYIALGCDGMQHRGPTAFAMLLSYSGCRPEHSVEIANDLWGVNFVPVPNRIAVARRGLKLGRANPLAAKRLTRLFLGHSAAKDEPGDMDWDRDFSY
jgi:hypothetical protein